MVAFNNQVACFRARASLDAFPLVQTYVPVCLQLPQSVTVLACEQMCQRPEGERQGGVASVPGLSVTELIRNLGRYEPDALRCSHASIFVSLLAESGSQRLILVGEEDTRDGLCRSKGTVEAGLGSVLGSDFVGLAPRF